MNFFYTICILLSVLLSIKAELRDDVLELSTLCRKESQLSDAEYDKYFHKGFHAADATDGIKRHYKCMMEKRGVFKDGKYDEKAVFEEIQKVPVLKANEALYKKVAETCLKVRGDNENDTPYVVAACFRDNKAPLGDASL